MIAALLQRLVGLCRHPDMYREHRELDGHLVVHLVCPGCGYAVPMLTRTATEIAQLARYLPPSNTER